MDKIFLDEIEWSFLVEIMLRTGIMFLMILLVLRLSGKRGVRQLTLFEVAIILGLGSAAGDPMFQEDIPIVYAVVVFAVVMAIYKTLTWLAARFRVVHGILEGKEMLVVKNGMFNLKNDHDNDFSTAEFFAELRNQSIEHLGQVRTAVLEVDGSMSVLYYATDDVKFGLPLFPEHYRVVDPAVCNGLLACMHCGYVEQADILRVDPICPRCRHKEWAAAMKTKRV